MNIERMVIRYSINQLNLRPRSKSCISGSDINPKTEIFRSRKLSFCSMGSISCARAHTYIHTYTICPVSLSLLLSLFPFIGHCSILPDSHGETVTPHIFLTFEHFDPISRDKGFVPFSPNDWNDLSECLPRSNIQIFDSDTLTCRFI